MKSYDAPATKSVAVLMDCTSAMPPGSCDKATKIVDGARRGLGKDDHAVAVPVLAGVERPDREGQRAGQGILLTRENEYTRSKSAGNPLFCLGVCDHRASLSRCRTSRWCSNFDFAPGRGLPLTCP